MEKEKSKLKSIDFNFNVSFLRLAKNEMNEGERKLIFKFLILDGNQMDPPC